MIMRAAVTVTGRSVGHSLDTSVVEIYRVADGQIIDIYYPRPGSESAVAIGFIAAASPGPAATAPSGC